MNRLRSRLSLSIQATPLRWHLPNKVDRMTVIQRAIDRLGATRYLEIGVADGACFCAIRAAAKIGVDPIAAAPAVAQALRQPGVMYHAMTSDDFFAGVAPSVLAGGVDVAFIDGLHTDDQATRDCFNTLRYLNPGGVIFTHDNLPASAAEARPAPSYAEAWRLNGDDWSGAWTGDGWKAIVRIRALRDDARAVVLDCDHGLGLIWAAPARRTLALSAEQIDALTYADLTADPSRLLGVVPPAYLDDVLAECREQR